MQSSKLKDRRQWSNRHTLFPGTDIAHADLVKRTGAVVLPQPWPVGRAAPNAPLSHDIPQRSQHVNPYPGEPEELVDDDTQTYVVVLNDEEQYSIWPADRD